jgi:outer membrane protein assembly factor BamB
MTDMTTSQTAVPAPRKPLRLWPGVAAAVLLVLVRVGVPILVPDNSINGVLGALAAAVVIVVWWLFFSRAPWAERLAAVVLMIVALAATWFVVHESIRGGLMGWMLFIHGPPVLTVALVAWAVASRRLSAGARRATMVVAILLACGLIALVRTGGITGDANSDLHWRWTPTAEERLLAQTSEESLPIAPPAPATAKTPATPAAGAEPERTPVPSAPAVEVPPALLTDGETPALSERGGTRVEGSGRGITRVEWSGFRGPMRDGIVRGVRINTDWSASPPAQIWRRPIGPGWSSFAVEGDLIYTQEQRGEHEMVSCYRLSTGEPVWMHRDPARFYESNGGPGPRGTPTLHAGRIHTVGATGIVNALDAGTGAVVWSRNGATDSGVELPGWGFTSSPLVVDDVVIVALSGRLVGYDAANGNPRWLGPEGGGGYSSPHLLTIDGVPQVLLLRGSRTISVAPADGTLLWEHTWQPGASIVQPNLTEDGDVLINAADAMGGQGLRRLAVAKASSGWTVEERWTSRALKPYFNDFVVHEGHAYGFDGSILASMDLADGTRKWKGGRYGQGQMVLLPDQDLLLVLSEEGELALVSATPDKFTEVARVKAVEGKTWNHPVLIGDILLVRNGEEMAAFRLALEPH